MQRRRQRRCAGRAALGCGKTPSSVTSVGAPAAVSVDAAKYKQATVLFADVVRSMDIAATVDVERLREIMTELVGRSAAVVQRYGGTVEYTGDGVMALFGAPVALEDHAFRACLAALAIYEEASQLAAEVQSRDGVELQLRIGLNSGRVIAGEIGSGSLGYAAIGEAVGFAQRMESVARPGGVMLSESTARLVEHTVTLADPRWVHIKGAEEPVPARRLLGIGPRDGRLGRTQVSLVGRRWEMAALDALVDPRSAACGGVVNVVGPPGIGKSRIGRESAAALAARRGVEVFWTFCESHAPVTFPSAWWRGCCGPAAAWRTSRRRSRPRRVAGVCARCRLGRICCCWTICSASPTPTPHCPRSTQPDARRRRWPPRW